MPERFLAQIVRQNQVVLMHYTDCSFYIPTMNATAQPLYNRADESWQYSSFCNMNKEPEQGMYIVQMD